MTLHEIEFLPKKYREKRTRSSSNISRLVLAAVVVGVMVTVVIFQLAKLHTLNVQVASLDKQHERISQLMQEVDRKRAEVTALRHHANLLAFMDHPYPKSQVIASITNPLPADIVLTRIQLTTQQTGPPVVRGAKEKGSVEPKGDPLKGDLEKLITELRNERCSIELEGTTRDSSLLYQFLADLHQSEVVESAKIESIDPQQNPDGSESSTFTAHVRIKRGHFAAFEHLLGQALSTANSSEGAL
ncbi:hypothetical protein AB1L30_01360 [Bremerella sp. JC817]|uniref:hypothetical protein n=1 Tax=Bremerella sp. JC817 TaxID=3231756 RepID=UPI0034584CCB